jgi:ferredoxin-nitrate reductase
VNDAFPTETTRLADVVFPSAIWGEKLGTFTNHDRTVHLSEKAVDAPGEARPDMDTFLEYARRMGVQDRDGQPLLTWSTPEECFAAFAEVTRGRPCDYSALTYAKLRGSVGIQWPCTEDSPQGTERLYTDHHFHTETDYTEDFGHDLVTGASHERKDHLAIGANGRAILQAVAYQPAHEQPSDQFPLLFTSGRTVHHFHTRTKTGRTPELEAAAPKPWVEISPSDAAEHGIEEDDLVVVESARGRLVAPARIRGNRIGVVFAPFHYGYWDSSASLDGSSPGDHPTAANELTMTTWDPVSKQPTLKLAAVNITKVDRRTT